MAETVCRSNHEPRYADSGFRLQSTPWPTLSLHACIPALRELTPHRCTSQRVYRSLETGHLHTSLDSSDVDFHSTSHVLFPAPHFVAPLGPIANSQDNDFGQRGSRA